MKKAVILDYQSLAPADLELQALWNIADIDWQIHDYTDGQDTAARIAAAEIVLTNKVVLNAQLLTNNPQLKLIIILATGTNNVDLEAARSLGIQVCNIVAYSTESVVQHTFASMLALQSHLLDYVQAVRQGDWSRSNFFGLLEYPFQDVAGKTLGIIGFGAIGQRVKQVAEAFNMRVLIAESVVPNSVSDSARTPLQSLYQQADIISIHSPLSPYTCNLIDAAAFECMKPTALLLNIGRGGIVCESALLEALREHRIAGAAVDVLSTEPPAIDNVLLQYNMPNLIVTPHTAWASRQARQTLICQVCDILSALMQGQALPNQVNQC